ncbi:hypothetical protein P3T76_006228 [Phytophthora citrophthora]|uniref:RxLR effector protein n=1 Tax=Phytophthora citrophthora TaxID=4793 RepID=A0AAD9LQ54_9STRA|nr:hypothetical protein P3T76_006228 [Phytophthora citrophthora]
MPLNYQLVVIVAVFVSITVISEVSSTISTTKVAAHNVRDTDAFVPRSLRRSNIDSIEEDRTGGAISVSTSEKLASLFKSSKVTDEQLQKWLKKGKSAEDVFHRMKLANAQALIFEDPLFAKWVQYVDDLSNTASGKGTSAISTLTAQYGDGMLYRMLQEAKKNFGLERTRVKTADGPVETLDRDRKGPYRNLSALRPQIGWISRSQRASIQ